MSPKKWPLARKQKFFWGGPSGKVVALGILVICLVEFPVNSHIIMCQNQQRSSALLFSSLDVRSRQCLTNTWSFYVGNDVKNLSCLLKSLVKDWSATDLKSKINTFHNRRERPNHEMGNGSPGMGLQRPRGSRGPRGWRAGPRWSRSEPTGSQGVLCWFSS